MSFDDSLSPSGSQPATEIVDIELDVRLLGSLVAEGEDVNADNSELLARLDSADTMASGVEARLDEILGTLDDLLTKLEPKDTDKPRDSEITTIPSEQHPPSKQS